MFFPNKIYFPYQNNRMKNVGDVQNSRKVFFSKKNKNLYYLLKNRYQWMNAFINRNDNILEIGAGSSLLKEFIKNKNYQTSDISNNTFLNFKKINALNTPFKNNSYSIVIASNMIHHIPYPLKLFKEVNRILKSGGKFLIQDVNLSLALKLVILLMRSEGYDKTVDALNENKLCIHNDPWSGNNAIPNLIFDNFLDFNQKLNNSFKLIYTAKGEFFSFLNSGGVVSKTKYIPLNKLFNTWLIRLDKQLTKFPKIFALQQSIVLQKK